jgi:Cu/Ag efflux pump CusA
VIGGLFTSTQLTLIVVPTIYRLFEGKGPVESAGAEEEEFASMAH